MKRLLLMSVISLLPVVPVTAQTSSTLPAPNPPVTHEALQAEQTRNEALIQHQRDQIDSLTRQMQALKAQLDTLSRELDETAAATVQADGRVSQATSQKYGVQIRH